MVTASTKKKTVMKDGKTYYVCSVCGRLSFRKIVSHGRIYCDKHYKQFKKYGCATDNSPRTSGDRNEIRIEGDTAYIDLYDTDGNVKGTAKIDANDVDKVKNIKWKLSESGYVMNSPKFKGGNIHLSRIILDTDQFVNHINHDTLDNRKSNLRIVTKSQNQMNSNYKGVTQRGDGKFYAHIKINQRMINLGVYVFEDEAMFARWYAETKLFKEYRYPKEKPMILSDREKQIMDYIDKKLGKAEGATTII